MIIFIHFFLFYFTFMLFVKKCMRWCAYLSSSFTFLRIFDGPFLIIELRWFLGDFFSFYWLWRHGAYFSYFFFLFFWRYFHGSLIDPSVQCSMWLFKQDGYFALMYIISFIIIIIFICSDNDKNNSLAEKKRFKGWIFLGWVTIVRHVTKFLFLCNASRQLFHISGSGDGLYKLAGIFHPSFRLLSLDVRSNCMQQINDIKDGQVKRNFSLLLLLFFLFCWVAKSTVF